MAKFRFKKKKSKHNFDSYILISNEYCLFLEIIAYVELINSIFDKHCKYDSEMLLKISLNNLTEVGKGYLRKVSAHLGNRR